MKKQIVTLPWHDTVRRLLKADCRLCVIIGEPGVGKTYFARHLVQELRGAEGVVISGSPELDLSSLWGRWTLVAGETKFMPGPLAIALETNRVMIIEDLTLIPIETRVALLNLNQETIECPFTNRCFTIPSNFCVIATSNAEAISSCRRNSGLSHIFFDRWTIVQAEEPSPVLWMSMLNQSFPNVEDSLKQEAIRLFQDWREFTDGREDKSRKLLTYRSLERLVALMSHGFDSHDAIEIAIVNSIIPNDSDLADGARLRLQFSRPGYKNQDDAHVR